jgi:hypothetical protein
MVVWWGGDVIKAGAVVAQNVIADLGGELLRVVNDDAHG